MEKLSPKLMNWASLLEDNTREQAMQTSRMPFVQPHLALMPDAHLGKGATVGSVIPTTSAIMPAAVGVDVGCGMVAVRTQFGTVDDLAGTDLSMLRQSIEAAVPLSAGKYNTKLTATAMPRVDELERLAGGRLGFYDGFRRDWRYQLGTLGSGNHFIEVTADETGAVWLFLHSGSRGVGNTIASHHIGVAKRLCERWFIPLPDPDLAYLVEETPEFDAYIADLLWAQRFAFLNRDEMMDRVIACLAAFLGRPVDEPERINCHHNFTQKERHFGRELWISRKGAIQADQGRPGLIPGSMGTASYVVVGKGYPPSFHSSPHGAGRVLGRNAAGKRFTMRDMDAQMEGVEYRRSDVFLDEIPGAYKDIDVVMHDAAELVEVTHTLHQIVNVKGD